MITIKAKHSKNNLCQSLYFLTSSSFTEDCFTFLRESFSDYTYREVRQNTVVRSAQEASLGLLRCNYSARYGGTCLPSQHLGTEACNRWEFNLLYRASSRPVRAHVKIRTKFSPNKLFKKVLCMCMCPRVCGGQEVRGHIGGLSCSPSYFETMFLADSDRLAGQGGRPSQCSNYRCTSLGFFF